MGFSLMGLGKGFADGINAEAAMEAEYKLAVGKSTAATAANLKLTTDADILSRTVNVGEVDYIDANGQRAKHMISFIKSNDPDAKARNIANVSSVMDASNEVIGDRSVLSWINDSNNGPLANSLISEYGKYMHPIIQDGIVKGDDGSFVLKEIYPFINDPFWKQQTSKMVRNKNVGTLLPGAFANHVGEPFEDGGTTIFPNYEVNIEDYTKSFWDADNAEQAVLARKPEEAAEKLKKLAYRWNRNQPKPYTDSKELMENFLFGLTDERMPGGIDRITAINIAIDLEDILKGGFQSVMGSTQKRQALMLYLGNLAENDVYIDNPQQLTEIFGYYFENSWTDRDTQEGYIGKTSYDKVAKSMGISKPDNLHKAEATVRKPIQRIDRILELAGDQGQSGDLPMGAIRQITLFGRGAIEIGGQAKTGIDSIFAGAKDAAMSVLDSDMFDFSGTSKDEITKRITALETLARDNNTKYQELVAQAGGVEQLEALYNTEQLDSAQIAIIDGTNSALIEYHTYLLAFEMAGAVQGGGDSRTISNRDVEMMRAAIRDRMVSSGKDFVGVLKEIRRELTGTLTVNRLWTHASGTRSIKALKSAKLYETLYNDMRTGDNPLQAFARKISGKEPSEYTETEKKEIITEEIVKKDTEVPIIKFGNYDSLSQMATGLKQITNFNEKSATFNLFKNQAIEAQKAGYTREHFVTELGEGITALFFPDVN